MPLWKQCAAAAGRDYVIWVRICNLCVALAGYVCSPEDLLQDYHVILLYSNSSSVLIYDFDTTLTFPCDAQTYWIETFRPELNLHADYHRYI